MKSYISLLYLFIVMPVFSQASWRGQLYFNLINEKGEKITTTDFENKKIKILILNKDRDGLTYDKIEKSFVYHSNNITEYRSFYMVIEKDTLKIEFPGLPNKSIFVKKPIELKTKVYSFFSNTILNFMTENNSCYKTTNNEEIFYFSAATVEDFEAGKVFKKLNIYLSEVLLKK